MSNLFVANEKSEKELHDLDHIVGRSLKNHIYSNCFQKTATLRWWIDKIRVTTVRVKIALKW